ARVQNHSLFFAPIVGQSQFSMSRQAVSMVAPREIVFVVDLSGSMNDDTEPCWASSVIDAKLASQGSAPVSNKFLTQIYADFGNYPGAIEYVGAPLGMPASNLAYAIMTQDDGPLAGSSIAAQYRISDTDTEAVRKTKAYSWIIDNQLARLMPAAKPAPSSANL